MILAPGRREGRRGLAAMGPSAKRCSLPPPTSPPELRCLRGRRSHRFKKKYAKKGLQVIQVIVKLANNELNPENPTYASGSWQIEGKLNEHICATALYYYSNGNFKNSRLVFRQQSDTYIDQSYPDEHDWRTENYGVYNKPARCPGHWKYLTREDPSLTSRISCNIEDENLCLKTQLSLVVEKS
ncbi:hypothetical protein B0H34DRAFT_430271 [Crassisporium funariophilum]|nr:hypothetical protein B0H34DRAFT_430271 [Crassisporium funariophilum]